MERHRRNQAAKAPRDMAAALGAIAGGSGMGMFANKNAVSIWRRRIRTGERAWRLSLQMDAAGGNSRASRQALQA